MGIFITVLVASIGVSVAFAAWTVGGSGTGTATATSAQPLTTSVATTSRRALSGYQWRQPLPHGEQPEPVPGVITSVNANGAAVADDAPPGMRDDWRLVHDAGDDAGRPAERFGVVHRSRCCDVERLGRRLPGRDLHHSGDVHRHELTSVERGQGR